MRCDTYIEITETLQDRTMDAIRALGFAAELGWSNVSCSRYVNVVIRPELTDEDGWTVEDGEEVIFKIRFSNHDDYHGSDLTIRFEHLTREAVDAYGDVELELEDWMIDEMIAEAVAATRAAAAALER